MKKVEKADMTGLETLRAVLMRMRSNDQDGFHDVGPDGKFDGHASFIVMGLPQVTPKELDRLMALVGIVPDPIITLGLCKDCLHARPNGTERGYSKPCVSCARPQMSHFTPVGRLTRTPSDRGEGCACTKCENRPKKKRS